jgi:phospholipase/carboxylesterase
VSAGAETLQHRPRPAAGVPEGALVLLHGRGTDEHDLAPLLDALDPEHRLVGATPRGPLSLPPGGAHWYIVREVGFPDRDTFLPTYEQLERWLDSFVADTGVPIERTVLGGFSQGTAMSYALGLGAGRPRPAGILALSGFIPEVEGLEIDDSKAAGLPVAIGHGTYDPVIGVEFGRAARDRLVAAGADVTYRESPMGHSVDPDYLPELSTWIARALERAPAGSAAAAERPPP